MKCNDRFVAGFLGKDKVFYVEDKPDGTGNFFYPLTMSEARKKVGELTNGYAAVYELVPVKIRRKLKGPI